MRSRRPAPLSARPELAERLRFPFHEPRKGQDLMLRDAESALESGLVLLCSAPTGIGKTAAALFPALRCALRDGRRVFFVTAKNSQQELALGTLRELIEPDSGVCAVQITAKERICPLDGRRCSDQRCRYLESFPERLERSALLPTLASRGVVESAVIEQRARERRLCPFEVSLALAERAHVVVSDLNYVFDPDVYLRRFFDRPFDRDLLLVDEAHNLPDRAIDYFSPELELARLEEVALACSREEAPVLRAAGEVLEELVDALARTIARLAEERPDAAPWVEPPTGEWREKLGGRCEELISGYTAWLSAGGERPSVFLQAPMPAGASAPAAGKSGRDPLLAALYAARDFCRYATADPERHAVLWTPQAAKLRCLDAAPYLRARVNGFHAAIFMSATLTPLDFYARTLGVEGPRAISLELASPFPRQNRLLAAVTTVDTTYRQRSRDAPKIARLISEVASLRPGNYLAFFSSFAYRDEVLACLPSDGPRVLLQIPGLPVEATLGLLRDNPGETRILFAVHGGVFSEGVDYPGELAIGVFVVGPGLPRVGPEQELLRGYFDAELGAGFEYAYLYPGLNRVVQAGGRAIRSHLDRAFTLLLCRRFAEPAYRSKLPAYWREELIETRDPVDLVREFWHQDEKAASPRDREIEPSTSEDPPLGAQ